MNEIEKMQYEIRSRGFLSALQIVLKLFQYNPRINKKDINLVLKEIVCKDIHKIEYTNLYVSSYKLKDLYYYNPLIKKNLKRRLLKKNENKKNKYTK